MTKVEVLMSIDTAFKSCRCNPKTTVFW